jgi:tripartite-type tricarboxylate transporter receptor subunit TctC
VHYKGAGPATVDVLGGHVGMMFSGISQSREHIDAGRLNAIAVTGTKRNPALPDVPTMAELGYPDVSAAGTYWGIKAPKGTPDAIIEKLSAELAEVMQIQELQDRLGQLGYFAIGSTPAEYGKHIEEEADRWANVVKAAGIKAE